MVVRGAAGVGGSGVWSGGFGKGGMVWTVLGSVSGLGSVSVLVSVSEIWNCALGDLGLAWKFEIVGILAGRNCSGASGYRALLKVGIGVFSEGGLAPMVGLSATRDDSLRGGGESLRGCPPLEFSSRKVGGVTASVASRYGVWPKTLFWQVIPWYNSNFFS